MDIKFDTAAMRAGSQAMGDSATSLEGDLAQLVGNEPAWGEDGISALCQMVYQAIVQVVQESGGGINGAWRESAEKMNIAADAWDSTEDANLQIGSQAGPTGA